MEKVLVVLVCLGIVRQGTQANGIILYSINCISFTLFDFPIINNSNNIDLDTYMYTCKLVAILDLLKFHNVVMIVVAVITRLTTPFTVHVVFTCLLLVFYVIQCGCYIFYS